MQRTSSLIIAVLMLGLGYWLGAAGAPPRLLQAQDAELGLTEDMTTKIRDAFRRLNDAREALQAAGKYEAVTEGTNAYLVLSGGGNARQDLESGRGVDPDTFAGLYAGRAIPEIQALLGANELGQITYNNEVVRMYSKSRLQRVEAQRVKLAELGL
jgi:hypothetical protein